MGFRMGKKIKESSTVAGSVAPVAQSMHTDKRSVVGQGIYGNTKGGNLLTGKKSSKKFANSIAEAQTTQEGILDIFKGNDNKKPKRVAVSTDDEEGKISFSDLGKNVMFDPNDKRITDDQRMFYEFMLSQKNKSDLTDFINAINHYVRKYKEAARKEGGSNPHNSGRLKVLNYFEKQLEKMPIKESDISEEILAKKLAQDFKTFKRPKDREISQRSKDRDILPRQELDEYSWNQFKQDAADTSRGAYQGVTFGTGENITAAAKSAFGPSTYKQELEKQKAANQAAKERSPYLYGGGEIAGSMLTPIPGGAAVAGLKNVGTVGKLALQGGLNYATGKAVDVAKQAHEKDVLGKVDAIAPTPAKPTPAAKPAAPAATAGVPAAKPRAAAQAEQDPTIDPYNPATDPTLQAGGKEVEVAAAPAPSNFKQAFAAARQGGEGTFTYKGKEYNTQLAEQTLVKMKKIKPTIKQDKLSPHEKFKGSVKRAGYDMDAGANRLLKLLDKQANERAARDKEDVNEWVSRREEFNPQPAVSTFEGAKVDRMVKHIEKSERATGKSKKDAENIAWATANKRGYLDNKNKKKHVAEGRVKDLAMAIDELTHEGKTPGQIAKELDVPLMIVLKFKAEMDQMDKPVVAKGQLNEFDPGEERKGPFTLLAGDHHNQYEVGKFDTVEDAQDEVRFLMDADPKSAKQQVFTILDRYEIKVWEQDPADAHDQMRSAKKIQFLKPGKKDVDEAANPAQQAAIAVNMKKHHQKPKNEGSHDSGEYDDESGMAHNQLENIARAVHGLADTIDEGDNLPEWVQKKLTLAEEHLITIWNYLQSEKSDEIMEGKESKFIVTCYNSSTDDKETILVAADDEYDAKDKINYSLGRGSHIVDVRPAHGDESTNREYKTYKHPTSGQSRTGIFDRKKGVEEARKGDTNFGSTVTQGSWVVYDGDKVKRFKSRDGAKAYAAKNGGKVASSEFYADNIQGKQGVAEGSLNEFAPTPDFGDGRRDDGEYMPLSEYADIIEQYLGRGYTREDRRGGAKHLPQVSVRFTPKDKSQDGLIIYSFIHPKRGEYGTHNTIILKYDEQGMGHGKKGPSAVPKTQKQALKIAQLIGQQDVAEAQQCPECGGAAYDNEMLAEKQDACYSKVKSRYKVWPSAYASGALVKCRKVGAKNWGNKSKKK